MEPESPPSVQSKSKAPKVTEGDLQAIQADVASFAAQLGLTPGEGFAAGFDDSDFRKTGPLSASKREKEKSKKKKVESAVEDSVADGKKEVQGKKGGELTSGVVKKGKNAKAGKVQEKAGEELSLSFGLGKSKEKGKGKKRSFSAENAGQEDDRITKKEKVDEPVSEKKAEKEVSLDRASRLSAKLFQASTLWYEAAAENLKAKVSQETVATGTKFLEGDEVFASKRKEAEQLLEKAVADYEKSRSKNSDTRWLMTARRSGTSADKVAAMTVMLQDNPMLNLRTLDALIGMVTSKGGKRHAAVGIDALKELFLISLLPDRKLKFLNQQPLTSLGKSKEDSSILLYWYWEDCLKRRYERFIVALEEATKDTLPFLKEKALKTVFVLLKSKPEQERRLLSALVNKLGDPERKVASNASYLLSCLLTAHPNMKRIVVEEVDSFVFRPHVGTRARYYAAVFLNQIILVNRGDGPMVAKQLINLYFALFRTVTVGDVKDDITKEKKRKHDKWKKKKNGGKADKRAAHGDVAEIDTRLLSALLTGVNRAFPYVAADDVNSIIEEHTPVLFRLVHSINFNVAVQALMLLHQLLLKNQAVSERFYRALYAVLLSPSLTRSSKAEMFLNLLFKALKEDIDIKRMAAFAKRLTQVALQQPPQFACGSLLLLSEVLKARPSLWDGILQSEDRDDEIEHFVDILDEDAVIKASSSRTEDAQGPVPGKDDASSEDISENNSDGEEENEKLKKSIPDLRNEDDDSSSDEENGTIKSIQKLTTCAISPTKSKVTALKKDSSKELTAPPVENESQDLAQDTWPKKGYYDPRHRDPSYCNGDKACWWELSALARHMHPSVASMARTLLSGANVVYSGDPLRDLVLGSFLDRFAEKKPKARKQKEDGSFHASAMAVPTKTGGTTRLVGEELLALDESEVAPDDVVFHKFYQTKATKKTQKKTKEKKRGEDEDDDITGLDDGGGAFMDGDDSNDDEVDLLLEKDEGMAMGLSGVDGEDDVEEDADSEGEFDYDKLSNAFDIGEDEENDDEDDDEDDLDDDLDDGLEFDMDDDIKPMRKGKIVESMDSDSDEENGSESDFDLGEPPESESEDDSVGSIEVGDLPSDEDAKSVKKETLEEKKTKKKRISNGEDSIKKTKRKKEQLEVAPSGKKGKSKSPFADISEYADLIEETEEGRPSKGKQVKGRGKKFKHSRD